MMAAMKPKSAFSALMILPFLVGCITLDENPGTGDGPVGLGQTAVLGDVTVTPLELIEDSRCPINARCISAGQLVIQVRIERATNVQTRALTAHKPSSIGPGMIELTEALPLALAGDIIAAEDYRFTFTYTPHIMD